MKGRLFAVSEDSRKKSIDKMELSIIVPEPKGKLLWFKTLQDIASDLFQLDIGDYAFLWEEKTKNIYGVYRIISKPFYRKEKKQNDMFKIKIEPAYNFVNPIQEYDIVNNPYMKNRLWNIVGKKISGKSRGTTPITEDEISFLIQSFISVNSEFKFIPQTEEKKIKNELQFDLSGDEVKVPISLDKYKYQRIKITRGNEVHYEKALEGILNLLIRDKKTKELKQLDINIEEIKWYANYLPYGLDRTEMDYMIQESIDGQTITKIDVIELMTAIIDRDHIQRCCQYARWASDALANGKKIIRPILICGNKSIDSKKGIKNTVIQDALQEFPEKYKVPNIDVYTYKIINSKIIFDKICN
ncbi:MAG: hypothetical protein VZQ47_01215 [Treponema sp.]|nr:hypothetical protein [Treponema sp.]MEE3434162.1 hypothetical protein [Treponema sp.]